MTQLAQWFSANIAPIIVIFTTTLGAVLTMAAPIAKIIRNLKNNSKVMVESNASTLAENAIIRQENSKYKAKIASLEQDIKDIKQMCSVAFLNNKELVTSGHAKEIAKILLMEDNENAKEDAEENEPQNQR